MILTKEEFNNFTKINNGCKTRKTHIHKIVYRYDIIHNFDRCEEYCTCLTEHFFLVD